MNTRNRPVKRPAPEAPVEHLAGLLDHLGRLLAEEYVALLTAPQTEADKEEGSE